MATKPVGRPRSVPAKDILKELEEHMIFDDNQELKKASNVVWSKILSGLKAKQFEINKQTLYLGVKNDKDLLKSIKKFYFHKSNAEATNNNSTSSEIQHTAKIHDHESVEDDGCLELLSNLKFSVDYKYLLKEVCSNPISVTYCWPQQIETWKDIYKLGQPVVLLIIPDCIQNAITFNRKSEDINLYSLISYSSQTLIPLFEVVSEKKHSEFIDYGIFKEWLRQDPKMPAPPVIVLPAHMPTIRGAIKGLNNCSLELYMTMIFTDTDEVNQRRLHSLVHADIIPILKYIDNLDKMNEEKEFYKKVVIDISLLTDLKEFKAAVKILFVFLISECRNANIDRLETQLTIYYSSDRIIENLLEQYNNFKANVKNIILSDSYMNDNHSISTIYEWINSIRDEALLLCTNYDDTMDNICNPYHLKKEYIEGFTNFLTYFPLWTKMKFPNNEVIHGFMHFEKSREYISSFKSFISSKMNTDSSINDIITPTSKSAISNGILENECSIPNMKVDDFIIENHCEYIKTLLSKIPKTIRREAKANENFLPPKYQKYLILMENWGGQGETDCNACLESSATDISVNCSGTTNETSNCLTTSADCIPEESSLISLHDLDDKTNYHNCSSASLTTLEKATGYENHNLSLQYVYHDHNYSCKINNKYLASANNTNEALDDVNNTYNTSSIISSSVMETSDYSLSEKDTQSESLEALEKSTSAIDKCLSGSLENEVSMVPKRCNLDKDIIKSSSTKKQENKSNLLKGKIMLSKINLREKIEALVNAKSRKKKQSKYYSAFKEIDQYHRMPQKHNYKSVLIVNGRNRTYRYKGKRYLLINTSFVDSLVELLSRAMKNYSNFKDYCEKVLMRNENVFLKMVSEHANQNKLDSYYKNRCAILLKYGTVTSNQNMIICPKEVDILYKKFMESSYCIEETFDCTSCNLLQVTSKCHTIKISGHEMDELCQSKVKKLPQRISNCNVCNHELRAILHIDHYFMLELIENDVIFDIEKMPTEMQNGSDKFILCGLIRLVPPMKKAKLNHYIAYVISNQGKWKSYNSISSKSNYSPVKRIRVSFMMYIKL